MEQTSGSGFSFKKILLGFFFLGLLGNVVYLDWKILNPEKKDNTKQTVETTSSTPSVTQSDQTCSQSCLSAIKQATASSGLPASETKPNVTTQVTSSGVKEFYVPFGSGTVTATDWQDAPGLQAYVDTTNYSQIKSVVFEASVHVPTGNELVNVRLYNVTDNHQVWNSEVLFNGGTSAQFLVSQPITLDSGNKLYKVQMKAQLNYPAVLDQSRVHIITY